MPRLFGIGISLLVGALVVPLWCGCDRGHQNTPVDSARAQSALQTALESWKGKQTPDELRSASAITVQDDDWSQGLRLISYNIKGPGKEMDTQLRCRVELVLQNQQGKETRKTVFYLIGTSPQITVFREVFPQ